MREPMLIASELCFEYERANPVIDDLSFSIFGGKVVGLLGENGAGKTTLFDLICGVKTPISGSLHMDFSHTQIAYLPQNLTTPPAMKISEVVDLIACLQGVGVRKAKSKIEALWPPSIKDRYSKIQSRRSNSCSYGEKRLIITAAMLAMNDTKSLFILDEPTAGVDVQYRYLMWKMIKEVVDNEKTIIVSSHILEEIGTNTDEFWFLKKGGIERYPDMRHFLREYSAETPDEAFINATVNPLCHA